MQIHWRNSQSKVRYQNFDLNGVDVLLAEFHESVRPVIALLSDGELHDRYRSAKTRLNFHMFLILFSVCQIYFLEIPWLLIHTVRYLSATFSVPISI